MAVVPVILAAAAAVVVAILLEWSRKSYCELLRFGGEKKVGLRDMQLHQSCTEVTVKR
jgi:hypothetical protein